MDFQKIEKKWQTKWAKKGIFEPKIDSKKSKFFFTVPYPYISGSLHIGHSRVVIDGDIRCRYMRMAGYNVLYPMAFHITGTPVLGISSAIEHGDKKKIELYKSYVRNYIKDEKKVSKIVTSFKEPWEIVKFFIPKMVSEFSSLGLSVDWSRKFNTGEKDYQKLIEWQFQKYNEKKYLTRGNYPVLYCVQCKNAVAEDDIKDGDSNPVEKQEFTLLKFKTKENENRYLVAATLRPETVYGQTNLWIKPEAEYVIVKVGSEEWILSKNAAEKLKLQKDDIKIVGTAKGTEFIGKFVIAPGIKKEIIVLPSKFVELDVASGIVTSVPSDAPYDWMALRDLQKDYDLMAKYKLNPETIQKIEPIPIIQTKEFGDMAALKICEKMNLENQNDAKLEEATQIVYKAGFHTGTMNENCGKYSGMKVIEAKEAMKQELLKNNEAELFYETSRKAACRCGGNVVVANIKDQWFIDFNSPGWKEKAFSCLEKMKVIPEIYRKQFETTFNWLDKRPVARRRGIGTPLPFDKGWVIESLSDSTIYMTFYTIKNLINKFKIKPGQMTPSFFDYIFLGKGVSKSICKETGIKQDYLNELKKSFEYWYPNDHRHTFVLHLSNHLSFFIFAHAAIFPEKFWPKKISFHGMIESEGGKMSKSSGNVISLLDVKNKFGADVFRAYLATATSVEGDFNWVTEEVSTMKKHVANLYELLLKAATKKNKGKISDTGKTFISKFESLVGRATEHAKEMQHREYSNIAIYEITNNYKKFMKYAEKDEVGEVNRQIIEKWIKLLSPIIPHIAEELWQKAGKKTFVSLESWPKAESEKINPVLEQAETLRERVIEDIKNIIKLVGKKPKSILLISAPEWKFELIKLIKSKTNSGKRDFKEIISDAMKNESIRKHGQEASKIIPKLVSESSKIPELLTGAKEELNGFDKMRNLLKKEFGCSINVESAEKSAEEKAKNAMPGKPAILVKT